MPTWTRYGTEPDTLRILDENPFLFFELRGIDANRFIDVAIQDHVEAMLDHADLKPTERAMDDACIESLFGLKL